MAILDSQAVLDWLYFNDPTTVHWEAARAAGQWHWVASSGMRDELAHVLARGLPAGRGLDGAGVLAAMDARVRWLAAPAAPGATGRLVCTDRDDQKFLDAGVAWGCRWLISRDKAVLKLAGKARRLHNLAIVPPRLWALPAANI